MNIPSAADMENTEAWAEIFRDILSLIPGDHADLLALVSRNDEAERAMGDELRIIDAGDLDDDTPGLRHWNAIMRLRSLIVQVFTRRISNNHSKPAAAAILFAEHPHGYGSRYLGDYLPPEPEKVA
jgi:hypothetical protein